MTAPTTQELIDWLGRQTELAQQENCPNAMIGFQAVAQRLRELDEQVKQQINDYGRGMAVADLAIKPDCVWHKVGETFDTACNARYRDGAYSTWKTCPNCSGKVRKST